MPNLATEYRPDKFDDVIGQDDVCASLAKCLEEERSRTFLFTGPSGVGKTTLARIIAGEVNGEVVEMDAATHTGVDAVRELQTLIRFKPFNHDARIIIVDECHALSKAAWQALLKVIEEPPPGVYWALCTTEVAKVIPTVKTRCVRYDLKPVSEELIAELLFEVAEEEGLETPEKVIQFCAEKAAGSPRMALTNLATCAECESRREAALMLKEALAEGEPIELCRALLEGKSPLALVRIVAKLGTTTNAESIRQVVLAYFSKVALGAKSEGKLEAALAVIDAFGDPYPPGNSIYPVLLSVGRLTMGD